MGVVSGILLMSVTASGSAALIILLKPLLYKYALARPNARSSHKEPTPQGAGVAVVTATLAGVLLTTWLMQAGTPPDLAPKLLPFCGGVLALALIGMVDDIAPLSPAVRLIGQSGAAVALYAALPDSARALPFLPAVVEAAICIVGLVWFVNLTNFMDGIDGISVAGIVPMLAGVSLLALGDRPPSAQEGAIALALAGALIGFAPFNQPVAQVFLGDVGSLAIGGMTGWLLLALAGSGMLVAALILSSYFLADTGVTLFRRWCRDERLSQAHREHFYQRATANGWGVSAVTARVGRVTLCLLPLSFMAATTDVTVLQLGCLAVATLLVADTLLDFAQPPETGQASSAGLG